MHQDDTGQALIQKNKKHRGEEFFSERDRIFSKEAKS
jgi:hypothetical protein